MALGDMRETFFSDQNLTQFQGAVKDQFSQFKQLPILNGVLISVSLTSGQANSVNHKLGRQATGYLLFTNSANSTVWNDSITSSTSISLHCSASTSVTVWVF